jgi:hypothetical protein
MLEPFTLTKEDVKKKKERGFSHYAQIRILQRKPSEARGKVLRHQASVPPLTVI